MGYIKVHQDKVDKKIADKLQSVCPFGAFDYEDAYLSINAACKVCKLCVTKGPDGVCEFIEDDRPRIDKSKYKGIAVYIEHHDQKAHPVSWELIGKAHELAKTTNEEIQAILVGHDVEHIAKEALTYGVNRVFVYDNQAYQNFNVETYTHALEHAFNTFQSNIILMGGTPQGRSFAPRVAARLKTGLTADCTMLDIKPDGDLLQIRPAFGGNIMAKIHTPNHRPQLATIRYKMFDKPEQSEPKGEIINVDVSGISTQTNLELIEILRHPKIDDISDAEVIIAVGRAFKKKEDLALIEPLRKQLNAEVACTRPLIENGWFDPRKQIGLSGRTVKPKLIINLGISGAVQYIEGMKDAEVIISINTDDDNRLFDLSHYAIKGDIYEILPHLNQRIESILKGLM